jgi:alpha-2-macroglobulin
VPGNKQPAGEYEFKIEEFVPNRLRTTVTIGDAFWLPGQPYSVDLAAEHLAGGAAADRRCESRIVFRQTPVTIKGWEGFRFNNDDPFSSDSIELGDARTDESGKASFQLPETINVGATKPLTALAVGRTFELGGRGVFGSAETVWFPSDTCLGVSIGEGSGGNVTVDVAAVTPAGEPAALETVQVTLEKRVWHYNVRRFYSHHEPQWTESFENMETREVALTDGRGSTAFDAGRYGQFRVRVHSEQTPQYSTQAFYSGWNRIEIVDEARPSLIAVKMDRERYNVGDEAVLRIESPFDGQAFIVLQGESFVDAARIPVTNGAGEFTFNIAKAHFPNIWAGVTVVHAIDDERAQVYPFESFAMAAVPVVDAPRQLDVAFEPLPDAFKPKTALPVTVTVTDHRGEPVTGEVTIAAIDEGIHSITGYETPEPYAWIARLRRPDHRRAHYYDKVAYDFSQPSAPGDLDALLGKRAASINDNWIKPLAMWSGPLTLDENGRADVSFDLPEFSGEVRLVAVAASNMAAGSAEARTKVRRDYDMRASVPRFLLPGDIADTQIAMFNRTDSLARATITWSASGSLKEGSGVTVINLAPQSEESARFPIAALQASGQGRLVWHAAITADDGTGLDAYERSFDIPVRTPAAFQSEHQLIRLDPGDGQHVRNTAFVDDARTEVEVLVSPQPQLQLADAIDYVVGYPHGCLEQTVSRLMPMYLLRKHSAITDSALDDREELDYYLQAGIERLFAMQTRSGGLGTWPGNSRPYPYGSVYALHFLNLVANGREYLLPNDSLEALRNYVRQVMLDDSEVSYAGAYRRAYATYALTLGGDPDAAIQVRRFDETDLPSAGRHLLASAVLRSTGDANRARNYLAAMPAVEWAERERGGTLNSSIRNTALELLSLTELGGDPNAMQQRANALTAFLRENRFGNTQETAFIIAALAGYLDLLGGDVDRARAEIEVGGDVTAIAGTETFAHTHIGPNAKYHIRNTGESAMFVSITTRGVPETVSREPESHGMTVTRSILTKDGATVESSAFEQAAAYVVALEIDCDYAVENVVLVDKLPAGFEIENPRLAADALPSGALASSVTPEHMDVRDDRMVLAFDKLDQGRHTYHYIVRAVTPGEYEYPAAQAECMYDAAIRGKSAAQTITIPAE